MADFSSVVELSIEVPKSEIRGAKQAIEGGIGSASVATDGGTASQATGGGSQAGRLARQRTTYLERAVEYLDNIEEVVTGGQGGMGTGLGGGGGLMGSIGVRTIIGGGIGAILGRVSLSSVVSGVSLSSLVSRVSLTSLLNPTTVSIAALVGGTLSLADLVDGDISSWNLPAKFGMALGKGFRNAWPGWADTIHTFFTENIFHDLGQLTRDAIESGSQSQTMPLGTPDNPTTNLEKRMATRRRMGLMTITEAMDTSPSRQQDTRLEAMAEQNRQRDLTVNDGGTTVEVKNAGLTEKDIKHIARTEHQKYVNELEGRLERALDAQVGVL